MAEFSKALQDYETSFLQANPSTVPEVACIFIGGSRLYNPEKSVSSHPDHQSDYDGIIVVGGKYDAYNLVTDKRSRQSLLTLVGIERDEEFKFQVPPPCSPLFSEWDGIQVSGFDRANVKRSIKVLTLQHFNNGNQSLNIVSHNDRRVYTNPHWRNVLSVTTLAQATTLDTGMLLHDQWLYKTQMDDGKVVGVFGPVIDLLLTSACVYGQGHGFEIKRMLLEYHASKTGYYPSVDSFTRQRQFSPHFIDCFGKQLTELCPTILDEALIPSSFGEQAHMFIPGETAKTQVSAASICQYPDAREVSDEALAQFNEGLVTRRDGIKAQFSPNSETYIVTTDASGDSIDLFIKKSPYTQDELEGAKLAARYFHRAFLPRMANSGELVYPLFHGISEHDARLTYIRGGRKDTALAESILYVEMAKAEYTLRTYRNSLCLKPSAPTSRQNIQRFFYDCLLDDRRIREFYGQGMTLAGQRYSLDRLLSFEWEINGYACSSLREAFDEAKSILAPESSEMLSCPTVFGTGDGHGGNVMFRPSNAKGGTSEFLFVDFETAGVHPVMIDFAKALCNDVFYETVYHSLLPKDESSSLNCRVDQDTNTIFLDFKPKTDPLSQAILDIKVPY
ncbi:hypothetical protein ONZ43_g1064 [Nemania bipapillata]|uniref:Uncharacterized protein n=1 Tax=Nemania bipapillata TaxID=110536 RepID=A0ACC2J5Q7_9PEZI|nr:hypothetical protein ONZ43_g1064 [Nemania bipapillata]